MRLNMIYLILGFAVGFAFLYYYTQRNSTALTTEVQPQPGQYLRLDKEFELKSLNRKRKIWLYLPPDYEEKGKRFPVLYLQDGQNLFDAAASFAGEWKIDETINHFNKQDQATAIVVGIENDGATRLDEYSPWQNQKYKKGGEGADYVNFIVQDLKPYIDQHYKTKSDRNNTLIGGSSMGALIAMYALMQHQKIFGMGLLFSPSFWFSEEAFTHVEKLDKRASSKIYLAAGAKEEGNIPENTRRMEELLHQIGFTDTEIHVQIDEDGAHNEAYWAKAFRVAYPWFFVN